MENEIKVHDIVQIVDGGVDGWVGCLLQVTDIKTWGVMGFVNIPLKGEAYLRVNYEQCVKVGTAVMVHQHHCEDEDCGDHE